MLKTNPENSLTLNKRFYRKQAVLHATEHFKELADFNVEETPQHYVVSVQLKKTDLTLLHLLREFANHCLAEGKIV